MKKSFSPGLSAALLLAGFGFGLTACGNASPECETTADCSGVQVCSDEGACIDPPDLCADVDCPGAQSCNAETGVCEGDCCLANNGTCGGDIRRQCDEAACLAGEADPCVDVTCPGSGPNAGCQEGFHCVYGSLECQADCVDGCENPLDMCNMTTGQCESRAPVAGELGTLCDAESPCSFGLTCEQVSATDSVCLRDCQSDAECGAGGLCAQGTCFDRCQYGEADACAPGLQCVDAFGAVDYAVCWPMVSTSTCTTNCTADGHGCNPARSDECEAGSACLATVNEQGAPGVCTPVGCHVAGQECADGATCVVDSMGFSMCELPCDPTDATACGGGENYITCNPGSGFSRAVRYLENPDVQDCYADETKSTFEENGQTWTACYRSCSDAVDCNPGETCFAATLSAELTVNACGSYFNGAGACASAACGDATCTDYRAADGNGGTIPAFFCTAGCTSDSECTDAPMGRCEVFSLDGSLESLTAHCVYPTEGASCGLIDCLEDTHCGACESDGDCGAYNGTSTRCDTRSHSCVIPASEGNAATVCPQGYAWRADAIRYADGATSGGCARPCTTDAGCPGGSCDVAAGFCVPDTTTCNSAGVCEAMGCSAATQADDCLHGTCTEGAGPHGSNVCE